MYNGVMLKLEMYDRDTGLGLGFRKGISENGLDNYGLEMSLSQKLLKPQSLWLTLTKQMGSLSCCPVCESSHPTPVSLLLGDNSFVQCLIAMQHSSLQTCHVV